MFVHMETDGDQRFLLQKAEDSIKKVLIKRFLPY